MPDWQEFQYRGRDFIRATVPKGQNVGREFVIARHLGRRYEVKKFFASGGCGLLLEGRDLRTETDVLIKTTLWYDVVEYAKGHDEQGFTERLRSPRKQLQTERRIMVLLKNRGCNSIPNPNDYVFDWNPWLEELCSKSGWQYSDERMLASEPYLIMERMDGQPLTALLRGPMPESRALGIMEQVCHVLMTLHSPFQREGREWRLVYQDLKPDNILIGDHDAGALLDLGGCRLYIGGQVGAMGAFTPGYCAPECQTSDPLGPASDSYTVGSTLFHVLTAISPEKFLDSKAAIGGLQWVPFSRWDWPALERLVSRDTFRFVQRCLAEKAADRPRNGEALVAEIESLRHRSRITA